MILNVHIAYAKFLFNCCQVITMFTYKTYSFQQYLLPLHLNIYLFHQWTQTFTSNIDIVK